LKADLDLLSMHWFIYPAYFFGWLATSDNSTVDAKQPQGSRQPQSLRADDARTLSR